MASFKNLLKDAKQVILVYNREAESPIAEYFTFEKDGNKWKNIFKVKSNIGRNGFAAFYEKREGDGKTPSGIFRMDTAFGYGKKIDSKMPYKQSTVFDFWVDAANQPEYNRWIVSRTGKPSFSVERMKRSDHLYEFGVILEYNTCPEPISGNGSAIFLHWERAQGASTAGCVSVSLEAILKTLEWLDPKKRPVIIMGTKKELITKPFESRDTILNKPIEIDSLLNKTEEIDSLKVEAK